MLRWLMIILLSCILISIFGFNDNNTRKWFQRFKRMSAVKRAVSNFEFPNDYDDEEEFELESLENLKEAKQKLKNERYTSNMTREFNLTTSEKMLLTAHNQYRADVIPTAANMMYLEWDNETASKAQTEAKRCSRKRSLFLPEAYGYNSAFALDETGIEGIEQWHAEGHQYHIWNRTCGIVNACDRYVQLMWAYSEKVGCAVSKCGFRWYIVVCLYLPRGDIIGMVPYAIGEPCSQCYGTSRKYDYRCYERTCMDRLKCNGLKRGESCYCGISKCHNCAILDKEDCRCICKDGWDGSDCSVPCLDRSPACNHWPGFSDDRECANVGNNVQFYFCRKMCHQCKVITPNGRLCCNGVMCPEGQVLSEGCRCTTLCPGVLCEKSSAPKQHFQLRTLIVMFIGIKFDFI